MNILLIDFLGFVLDDCAIHIYDPDNNLIMKFKNKDEVDDDMLSYHVIGCEYFNSKRTRFRVVNINIDIYACDYENLQF